MDGKKNKNKFVSEGGVTAASDSWRGGASEAEVRIHRVASLSDVNKAAVLEIKPKKDANTGILRRGKARFTISRRYR